MRESLQRIKTQAEEERRHFELTAEAADRKNGDTFKGSGPDRHAIDALSRRFMTEHYEHMGEWARWALSEIDRWDESTRDNSTGNSTPTSSAGQSRPESSIDVVSIDE